MAEYRIKDGGTLTDEDVERLGEACGRGDYRGSPGSGSCARRGGRRFPTSRS